MRQAAEFFGGRRYLFGVDQWEERIWHGGYSIAEPRLLTNPSTCNFSCHQRLLLFATIVMASSSDASAWIV